MTTLQLGASIAAALLLLPPALLLLVRSITALFYPPLRPWHTHLPPEATAAEINLMDWPQWLAREDRIFADVEAAVCAHLPPSDQVASNRYWPQSPFHRPADNRSSILLPASAPKGVVVLLHGLTDGPWSMHHLARLLTKSGLIAISIRLPGHGTLPSSLTRATRHDWKAASRLAMREAARLAGPNLPISMIGYSNGAALALDCAFDALESPASPRPASLILVSPMIGLTAFARFAGIAGWPAHIPGLGRAAWISTGPESNPFKYVSFPTHAAVQSFRLTHDLQARIDACTQPLPRILAFQSVVDSTVSAVAVSDRFLNRLPPGPTPHHLILFDINHASSLSQEDREKPAKTLAALTDEGPHAHRTTLVTTRPDSPDALLETTEPGESHRHTTPLGLPYPANILSLSHIALPFPAIDPFYGPPSPDPFLRGETGLLTNKLDRFARLSFNPFFTWLAAQVVNACAKDTA